MTTAKLPANEPIDAVYSRGDAPELRYSLRSLARYAPWIRKVHLLTGGETPAGIRPGNPRLALVKREEIARDRPVEWQLYRIPGLSRQFLYLEPNFFLGRPLAAGDFVTAKNGNRFFTGSDDIPSSAPSEALLNARFGKRSGRKQPARLPRLLDKNLLEEVNRLWEVPIRKGDVSLDFLYFHFLLESPLQYGIHEQTAADPQTDRRLALGSAGDAWKEMPGLLWNSPRFYSLEAANASAARAMRLWLRVFYWRRSPFEK